MRADGAVLYDLELIQCEMKSISWPSHWFILDIFKKDNIFFFFTVENLHFERGLSIISNFTFIFPRFKFLMVK